MTDTNQPIPFEEIHRLRRRQFSRTGLFSYLGIAAAAVAVLVSLEHFFYLESVLKTTYVTVAVLLIAILGFRFYRQPAIGLREFTKRLSEELGSDELIRLFDLQQQPPSPFSELAKRQLLQTLHQKNTLSALHNSRLMARTRSRLKLSTGFLAVSALALAGVSFQNPDALHRALTVTETFFPPNPYLFSIYPGDQTLEMGSAFDARIVFRGRQPRTTWLEIKSAETDSWRRMPVQREQDSVFAATGLLLNIHFQYRFRMDDYTSGTYDTRVEMLPRWEKLQVSVQPPAYTGQPANRFEYPVSQFDALPGSVITIRARANKPLATAALEALHHTPSAEAVSMDSLNYRFTFTTSDTLAFTLTDTLHLSNKNRFQLMFNRVEDASPNIAIVSPEPELQVSSPDTVRVHFVAQDDFGFRRVALMLQLQKTVTGKQTQQEVPVQYPASAKLITQSYVLDLAKLGLEPMDEIRYWFEVQDNDVFSGFKKATSAIHVIKIAGLADLLLEMEGMEENIETGLDQADSEFESVQREFKELKESLQRQDKQGWDQQQNVQRMQDGLEKIEQKVEEAKKEFEKLREELGQNNVLSEETRQQYDELQKLMEQISDPAILKLLEEMEKSLQNIDQNQLRQALENFEFSEERYRERLQRTMDLFKSLQTMAEIDKLEKRLEELENREKSLESPDVDNDRFQKTQENVAEELKAIDKTMEKLPQNAAEKQRDNLEKLNSEMKRDMQELQKQLQESVQQNKNSGKKPDTAPMQKQLQKMRSKLAEAKSGMSQKALNINIAALKGALIDLIFLSEVEEQVIEDVGLLDFRSEAFTRQARRQSSLMQQFNRISDTLAAVSKEIPQVSSRVLEKKSDVTRRLNTSLTHLAERDKNNASADIRFAMGGINELASMIADLIKQLEDQQQQSGDGGGGMSAEQMMEQMKNMSGQQQKLNQQMQDLINDIQGNRLTQSQMERLDQMSKQQNEIRKKLREMQQKSGLSPGDRVLSELERLAQQMEESINEMRGGNTDRIMITRQQNILTRMLEVEKALDQREEDEKRKGDKPKELPPAVKPAMTMEELKQRIRERMNDPKMSKLSPEFEEMVRLYFELLGGI
jgi:hypothetical protein